MYDVVALGELLIDFMPLGNRSYQANPGGAPANVLAAVANLGFKTSFLGMVGEDDFGHMLKADLDHFGIDTGGLCFTQNATTTMAFVHLDSEGDRSFTFVRKPGADMLFSSGDVDFTHIVRSKVFHFGSVSMSGETCCEATLKAAAFAQERGITVSFDPNLRPLLWPSTEYANKTIPQAFKYADIVKLTQEELEFFTGETDMQAGATQLHVLGAKLVFVTMGPRGCFYSSQQVCGHMPTYLLPVVDTTGAGDAFMGGVLARMLELGLPLNKLAEKDNLLKLTEFGNAVGALATTKRGGMFAMPHRAQVEHCIKATPKLVLPTA